MIAAHQLLERVGATAGSDLYHARHVQDGTLALAKVLAANAPAAQAARLRREYERLRALDVARIVKPTALCETPKSPAILLPDVAGQSLDSVIENHRFNWQSCLRLALQLTDILEGLHGAGIIHSDIRPVNFILNAPGDRIYLVDLSRALSESEPSVDATSGVASDWAYVSPEQTGRMNRPLDYRTDFYSLGVLLYRLLTGQLPFTAKDPLEWVHCHIARLPEPPHEVLPDVPVPLSHIVLKLLAKSPEDRYQTARGLRHDLERCHSDYREKGQLEPFDLGTRDLAARFQTPQKLYGREKEAAILHQAFERLVSTGQRTTVIVAGRAGVGKSALVDTLRRPVIKQHGYFITGKGDQHLRHAPYAAITEAFRQLVAQLLAQSEAPLAAWRQRLQTALGKNAALLVDLLPQLELVTGPQPPMRPLQPAEAHARIREVFRRFVDIFTEAHRPLVIFLDDLQWVDTESLQLLEGMLTHSDMRHLLLLVSYRDPELTANHTLRLDLDSIRQSGASVEEITLLPLGLEPLNQLVADTLCAPPVSAEPLSRLLHDKTEGNPFFAIQYLQSLHTEGLVRWDQLGHRWTWDFDQIAMRDFADSVTGLMLDRLGRLPKTTQQLLQLAACFGTKFDWRDLAATSEISEVELARRLASALQAGLIARSGRTGKFLHDRIRQAAYSTISRQQQAKMHLSIARTLLAPHASSGLLTPAMLSLTSCALLAEELDERLFEVVHHLNRGSALLVATRERELSATLNLRAARKAKASAAYEAARLYLHAGTQSLRESDWQRSYQLAFDLHFERAHCAFLQGRLAEAEQLLRHLLAHTSSKLHKAAIYGLKIQIHVLLSQNREAVDCGRSCLRLFGIELPAHPTAEQVRAEYEVTQRQLNGHSAEALVNLPRATDPAIQAVMSLLAHLFSAAPFSDPNLAQLLFCRVVTVTLQHGITSASPYGLVGFGLVVAPAFHRYDEGWRLGYVARTLVEKYGFSAERASVYLATGLVALWAKPVPVSTELLRQAARNALETGDPAYVSYSYAQIVLNLLLQGAPLDTVWRETEAGLRHTQQAGFVDATDVIVTQRRFIANLQGRTAHFSTFADAQFDESAFESRLTEARHTFTTAGYWVRKVHARFLSGDYAAALFASAQARRLRWALVGVNPLLDYHYYTALAIAARYANASREQQSTWRDELVNHLRQLREWAETYPPTFRDKFALVTAELARIDGRDAEALHSYGQAIRSARDNGFVQNEAIAHELLGQFFLSRELGAAAKAHLKEACACFRRWGAHGKVSQLESCYPELRALPSRAASAPGDTLAQLDLLSVTKASQAISGQIMLSDLVETLMQVALENATAQLGLLFLRRDGKMVLAADAKVERSKVRVSTRLGERRPSVLLPSAVINYVQHTRERVLLDDAMSPHPFSGDDYFQRHRPKSLLCLPILRQDQLLGMLYLENRLVPNAFTRARLTVLDVLAAQAAISLENALLYSTLHEQEARVRRLVASNIIGVYFWDLTGRIYDANEAFLRLVGYSRGDVASGQVRWTSLTPPEYRYADTQKSEELVRTGSFTKYEKEFIRKDGRRVPVLVGAAAFEEARDHGVAFVLDLSDQKRAEARIVHLAHYDLLTNLPNRVLFEDRLQQAIAFGHRQHLQDAVLFLDIDHFKHINDSLGHSVGDRLLKEIAVRLTECLRKGDTAARWGGDEFVLCLPLIDSSHGVAQVAQKLLMILKQPFLVDGHALHVTGSIGISLYPQDGTDAEGLLRAADLAMYHAKAQGRDCYQFFKPALNHATQQRLAVANSLSQALERKELAVHYQPQVDLETGRIVSGEALLRWQRPNAPPVTCADFIGVAEETGLILPIGAWALHVACRQLQRWRAGGYVQLCISVNVSARQFQEPSFLDEVQRTLHETKLPATALNLEITESILMQSSGAVRTTLKHLSDMGVQLSVDDFGTGYSNLAYLHRFPLSSLKIDQSFVRGIGENESDSGLVAAIIAMANILHLKVVAEGVETETQVSFLMSHGCRAGQGFYYAEPAPADAFTELLRQQGSNATP